MTDLNTLIPSSSPLYLYLAATIDDFGVIVGYASDQTANTSPAFVAIPKFIFGALDIPIAKPLPSFFSPNLCGRRFSKI